MKPEVLYFGGQNVATCGTFTVTWNANGVFSVTVEEDPGPELWQKRLI